VGAAHRRTRPGRERLKSGASIIAIGSLVAMELLGPDALLLDSASGAVQGGRWVRNYLRSRAATIGTGTAEIQRNTIAERVLGLPQTFNKAD
jgi:alkylation response protein AidB-like acyl-CoA dehydrogenase